MGRTVVWLAAPGLGPAAGGMRIAGLPFMNFNEIIQARRAVRAFQPRQVEERVVRDLLRAAVLAPSAMNTQAWLFAVVQNAAQLKRYSDRGKELLLQRASRDPKTGHYAARLEDPKFNVFYDATTLIAIAEAERGTYTEANCWLAAENLMLAACDAGLGSCPIGFSVPVLNTAEVKAELNLPASAVVVAPIIVGYPSAVAPFVPRNDPRIVSWSR
jgi:nitroreductase